MRLSRRIYALAECVNQGESVADIGTDHGYVPMILVRDNISPKVIMSDISADSLSKAKETFRVCHLECPEENYRVGDGLATVSDGEVDDIIIAGLGGHTIANILQENPGKSRSFSKIIMQPRKHSGYLRYFLYCNGFNIISEKLVPEGKFICEIITAVPSDELTRIADKNEEDIIWRYPQAFAQVDNECVEKRIGWKLASINEEIENLRSSRHDRSSLIEELIYEKQYLNELLEANREYWNYGE